MLQIHEQIKNERLKKRLTEDEVAGKLNITRTTYQYWEKKTPSVDKVKRVAKALGLPEDYFFGKKDEAEKPIEPKSEDQQKIILDTSFILDLLSETRKEKAALLEVIQANLNTLQVTQQVILAEIKAGLKWEAIKAGAGSEKKTAEVLHKIDTIVDEYMPAVSHAGSKERT